ncbi:btk-binding protein-related [Anaeramoeba flamelloides]|uniref:Btk-binding protein-related n=1 Tax=Anaeramoeba flamelloides TaxID=1746091 RepID=A0ABQ8X198_9EUKA|nr:btk-binding protein-related [Anaeramoeba flamelloides]
MSSCLGVIGDHPEFISGMILGNYKKKRIYSIVDLEGVIPKQFEINDCSLTVLDHVSQLLVYGFDFECYKLNKIKHISVGKYHTLALTNSGEVYSFTTSKSFGEHNTGQLGRYDVETNMIPTKIQNFGVQNKYSKNKKVYAIGIYCNTNYSFILTRNLSLYCYGNSGSLKEMKKTRQNNENEEGIKPKIIDNVSKVFCSTDSKHAFFISGAFLYAFGCNKYKQLALSKRGETIRYAEEPMKVSDLSFQIEEIKNIEMTQSSSVLLLKSGRIFTVGEIDNNGRDYPNNEFEELFFFRKNSIQQIFTGLDSCLLVSQYNEIFIFGKSKNSNNTMIYNELNNKTLIKKMIISQMPLQFSQLLKNTNIKVGPSFSIYFQKKYNSLSNDLLNFLKCKTNISSDLKVFKYYLHRVLVRIRTGQTINNLLSIFRQFPKAHQKIFLIWIYSGIVLEQKIIKKFCSQLQIMKKFKNNKESFVNDMQTLSLDLNSCDFYICSKDGGRVPAHKFILYARTGLFRGLFDSINENSNQVTDYSGRSSKSIKIFVHYLYTETILEEQLTLDLINELIEAEGFYQLSENSSFKSKLLQKKKQLKRLNNRKNVKTFDMNDQDDSNCNLM